MRDDPGSHAFAGVGDRCHVGDVDRVHAPPGFDDSAVRRYFTSRHEVLAYLAAEGCAGWLNTRHVTT